MFNELTLTLHILLLVSIYLFLFAVVKTIAKDVTASDTDICDNNNNGFAENDVGIENKESEKEFSKILFVKQGAKEIGTAYTIYDELLIGRAPDCDIVLDDSFVSSHHVRVYQTGTDCWLEDLNSTNGTLIEKTRLDTPVRLSNGDEFTISDSTFKFVV